jgi:hypothetical protein
LMKLSCSTFVSPGEYEKRSSFKRSQESKLNG